MIGKEEVQAYQRDGFIVVPDVLGADILKRMRDAIARLVAASAEVNEHSAVYDLEPGHTAADPRVRRIKQPHKMDPVFDEVVRSPQVIEILTALLGPDIRLQSSKLNMKSAGYGSPVEWHQDWAFYPHTNDDILAIGVMLDDTDLSNGPLLISPGTHTGPVYDHHGSDGRFAGMIDPDLIRPEIERAVPFVGRAGSMSFFHVRALHGSARNTSDRPRNLLIYEITAGDAWPLVGLVSKGWDEVEHDVLAGKIVRQPRLKDLPVRLPLPPPLRAGSIYEMQSTSAAKSYFSRTS
jgi:ectoine hydroxylase-related dioxygenase (phytanoyl-CoA dioxygenase family)